MKTQVFKKQGRKIIAAGVVTQVKRPAVSHSKPVVMPAMIRLAAEGHGLRDCLILSGALPGTF